MKKPKTLKREFAVLAVWLPFLALVALVAITSDNVTRLELIQILLWPAALLAGGAFGLDAVGKQIRPEIPPPVPRTEPEFDNEAWPVDTPRR